MFKKNCTICVICLDPLQNDLACYDCGHVFHLLCIQNVLNSKCPSCRRITTNLHSIHYEVLEQIDNNTDLSNKFKTFTNSNLKEQEQQEEATQKLITSLKIEVGSIEQQVNEVINNYSYILKHLKLLKDQNFVFEKEFGYLSQLYENIKYKYYRICKKKSRLIYKIKQQREIEYFIEKPYFKYERQQELLQKLELNKQIYKLRSYIVSALLKNKTVQTKIEEQKEQEKQLLEENTRLKQELQIGNEQNIKKSTQQQQMQEQSKKIKKIQLN